MMASTWKRTGRLLFFALAVLPGEVFCQDAISGKFYRFSIAGRTGLGGVNDVFLQGPSINDAGAVAFVGRAGTQNAVFVSDVFAPSPRLIAQNNNFSFLSGVSINNTHHLLALDSPGVGPNGIDRQYFLRDWNAPPSATPPYTNTLVAGASTPIPSQNDFLQLYFPSTISNAGHVSFTALKTVPGPPQQNVSRLASGIRPFFSQIDVPFPPNAPLQPMVTDDGKIVVRVGNLATDPIRLYDYNLGPFVDIATTAMGFTALGRSPGVSSANGDVVVFYGELSEEGAASSPWWKGWGARRGV